MQSKVPSCNTKDQAARPLSAGNVCALEAGLIPSMVHRIVLNVAFQDTRSPMKTGLPVRRLPSGKMANWIAWNGRLAFHVEARSIAGCGLTYSRQQLRGRNLNVQEYTHSNQPIHKIQQNKHGSKSHIVEILCDCGLMGLYKGLTRDTPGTLQPRSLSVLIRASPGKSLAD